MQVTHPFFLLWKILSISIKELNKTCNWFQNRHASRKCLLILTKINRHRKHFNFQLVMSRLFFSSAAPWHTFDEKLSFSQHIKAKIQKAGIGVNVIRKLNNLLPQQALLTIYKSFVRPHLGYHLGSTLQ